MPRPCGKKKERRDKPCLRPAGRRYKKPTKGKKASHRREPKQKQRDGHPQVAATRDEARKCRLCRTFLAANASDSWKIPEGGSMTKVSVALRGLVLGTLLFSAAIVASAQSEAQQFPVATKTLKNGMKVLVQTDHSIPNVALYIFYRIGSRNEHPGTTGLSHFFEHMMFNGSKNFGPGEFDRVMEAAGGSNNAYTTNDVTVYEDWFPRTALDKVFDLEADRIANLSFDPDKIVSERGVVASERRLSVDNNNFGILSEQMWASAYLAHPYQWPVIGWTSDIEH